MRKHHRGGAEDNLSKIANFGPSPMQDEAMLGR